MATPDVAFDPPPAPFEGFRRARNRRHAGQDLNNKDWRPFFFVQMADTQLGFTASWAPRYDVPDNWEHELRLMNRAVDEINRLHPAFAIICGDLINEWPDHQGGSEAPRAAQTADFKRTCARVDPSVPLVCVCGNHDIGDIPNATSIEVYRREFGDEYFSFWVNGVKCIVVNSQLWKDASDAAELLEAHDSWLAQELESAEGAKHILVFAHAPLFINDPDEPDGYFNIERAKRLQVLQLLTKHGVRTIFCGHYHRNAGGRFRGSTGDEVELVVTGAVGGQIKDKPSGDPLEKSGMDGPLLGEEVSGMRLVQVEEATVAHQWYSFQELAAVSPETVMVLGTA